jgi:flagellar basal-body rod modification protein FlgD
MSSISGVSSERNYESIINSAGKEQTENVYGDAVFSDSSDDSLSVNDIFSLMITQLTNQDFLNPVDDTQYLAQLAQFSTMQQMMELAQYSKTNYATSLIGKEVTIAKNSSNSNSDDDSSFVTGIVDRVSIKNDTYYVQVNGVDYTLSQINSFGNPTEEIGNDNNVSDNNENNVSEESENEEVKIWL